jgi:hypothetical protein
MSSRQDFQLRKRINKLPYDRLKSVKDKLIKESGQSRSTLEYVLSGRSSNLNILRAFAKIFECTVDQVIDPNFDLILPEHKESQKQKLPA